MKALITGASSGIGRDMAKYLAKLGYDLVIVARRENLLQELKEEIENNDTKTSVEIEVGDISNIEVCKSIFEKYQDVDFLINNAGFGKFGEFKDIELNDEISMINTNITGLHVLTKLYIKKMVEEDKGRILNVASSAGLMPGGPLMSTYYATKAYVVSLTRGIREELKSKNSKVVVSCLCPGPVDTEFNKVAKVQFSLKGLSSEYVAKYTIDKCLKGKEIIVPGIFMKIACFGCKIVPSKVLLKVVANQQRKKME